MGAALHLNKTQILFLLLVILSLLVTAALVLHAATPHMFHELAFKPQFINRR